MERVEPPTVLIERVERITRTGRKKTKIEEGDVLTFVAAAPML